MLRQNPCTILIDELIVGRQTPGYQDGNTSFPPVYNSPTMANVERNDRWPENAPSWASLDNKVLAKFNGKLRKGGASLGVSLASWKQSREMIVRQFREPTSVMGKAIRRLESRPGDLKRLQRQREPLANQVLEVEFGWRPLVADITAALTTVCKDGIPDSFIRASHREHSIRNFSMDGYGPSRGWHTCTRRSTMSATVVITNPNLWLLNRLGLVNPFVVAWDLVPWSWVANMFLNVNQLLNSLTDWVGLTVSDLGVTHTGFSLRHHEASNLFYPGLFLEQDHVAREKIRVLNQKPDVSLRLQVPNFNWELALIASSVAIQRVKTLNRMIKGF